VPDLQLDLDILDVDGFHIIDPDVFLRLSRSDGSGARAWRVALNGQRESLTLHDAPAGDGLILRVTPSRYRDIAFVCRLSGDQIGPASPDEPIKAPRRPSEWLPVFTRWAVLPSALEDLKTALGDSLRFRLGRSSEAGKLVGDAYDGVNPRDESRALAKLSLLNLYSRLVIEPAPTTGEPWSQRIQELFLATRERIIARVDQVCYDTVRELSAHGKSGYHKAPVGDHLDNLREIPGASNPREAASIKTREAKANLQFTVARAELEGQSIFMLDCDMDENGKLLAHTFDLIKHLVTDGTHPIDIHEALREKFPAVPLGYALEPRVLTPHVSVTVLPAAGAIAPPAPSVPTAPLLAPLARPVRRIAVLGDSVAWGQGLLEAQKMHTLVGESLGDGVVLPATRVLAHSGATIGVGVVQTRPPVDGEVPRAHPTILQQCAAFPQSEASEVELLIINGGINDIDVRFILNPFTDQDDLMDTTTRACGSDLAALLREAAGRFGRARIAVLEYFPILSPQSRFTWGAEFLAAIGAPVNPTMLMTSSPTAALPIWARIVENCRVFHTTSSAAIRSTVALVTGEFDHRIVAIDPAFREENAALAPQAWLFGINWDLSPQDPVASQRRVACDLAETDPFRREQCYRASSGHPNALGAVAYSTAIVTAVAGVGV
jgi:hypothetical protein